MTISLEKYARHESGTAIEQLTSATADCVSPTRTGRTYYSANRINKPTIMTYMKMLFQHTRSFGFAAVLAGALLMTGCDDATGPNLEGETTFEGVVTDDAGFGKTAGTVDGAVVTASNVTASGSTNRLEGSATTNAQGRFELHAEDAADEVVLTAEKSGFRSKVMVFAEGRSSVRAMPMTTETHGEAEVFVEARQQDDEDDVTMSDVAVYVTKEVAAETAASASAAADVAAAIVAEARTRKDYIRDEDDGEEEVDDAREKEAQAFIELQADLSASSSTSAQTAAIEAFEQALIEAYTEAGVSIETQARARQAARAALVRFSGSTSSSARFHLRKKAELLAAIATSEAVEASFRASGATSARIDALQQAQSTLIARLRAATSASAVADAKAEYESKVEDELAAEIGVNSTIIANADAAMDAAKVTLELALATASSARAVAQAHASFYATAEAAARSSFGGNSNADFGARVLALLSAAVS